MQYIYPVLTLNNNLLDREMVQGRGTDILGQPGMAHRSFELGYPDRSLYKATIVSKIHVEQLQSG